jgi:hypothetical protein
MANKALSLASTRQASATVGPRKLMTDELAIGASDPLWADRAEHDSGDGRLRQSPDRLVCVRHHASLA